MSWKNFLKPTKEKIILVIILLFITISVGILAGRARVEVHTGIGASKIKVKIFEGIETILILPSYLIGKYIIAPRIPPSFDIIYSPSLIEMLLLIVSTIFYWYLLSCLIIFVYERLKEKLRKR